MRKFDLHNSLWESETGSLHFILQIRVPNFIPHKIYNFKDKRVYFETYRPEIMPLYLMSLRVAGSKVRDSI